jgi:competence protein ComEC
MLDVGQGDAVLLRDGSSAVLVDGGGWPGGDFGGRVLVPALVGEGVSRLAAAVLTHADTDHCAGLVDAASYLPIDEVWMAAGEETSGCGAVLAATPGARLRLLRAGDRAAVGLWRFRVLHPAATGAAGPPRATSNARSLVLVATAGSRRCLLTGDVEAPTERRLTAALVEACGPEEEPEQPASGDRITVQPGCQVLKIAHHGSKTSTTRPFLAAAAPRLALVSAGRGNPYGHPAPEVVDRLHRAGIRVLRTDLDGAIRLVWRPGDRLGIQTLLPRSADHRER